MDVAYVSALSALIGSVVGGLISGSSTWASQRLQAKSALLSQAKLRARRPLSGLDHPCLARLRNVSTTLIHPGSEFKLLSGHIVLVASKIRV
jgi:hypothetical protein